MPKSPSLLELQHAFADSMLGEQYPLLAACVRPHGLEPEQRLQVYRNMVIITSTETLRTSYPAVLALVGEDFFTVAASRYVRAYPSQSGNLQDYGARFPDFLAAMPEALSLNYLADVARLEWARQQACLAEESTPLDSSRMSAVAYGDSRLLLSPGVHLICSPHPILDIWRFSQAPSPECLTLDADGQQVLVWPDGYQVAMQAIDQPASRFIAAIIGGASMNTAYAKATEKETEFNLQGLITLLLHHQLICAIKE